MGQRGFRQPLSRQELIVKAQHKQKRSTEESAFPKQLSDAAVSAPLDTQTPE